MSAADDTQRKRILDPVDRITEAIFGIIIVLTFTCTLSAAEADRADVKSMLFAAIGCNIAWGLVDAVVYVGMRVTQQLRGIRVLKAVRESEPAEARRVLADALPPVVVEALSDTGIEQLRLRFRELPARTDRVTMSGRDWLGAVGIFLIAFVSMVPILLPFALMEQAHRAMRVSNGIALVMLFLLGSRWAGLVGLPRWSVGIAMALGGAVLVAITIALGG